MCWTQPYTRYKTKTNKTKNTPLYVLDTTIHKIQDQDKQNKKHTTICVGHNHTQDTRPRQTKQKHNTICVRHHYTQDTRPRQTKQKTQHNMC